VGSEPVTAVMRLPFTVSAIIVGLMLALAGEAIACVCAGTGARELFRSSDAAIIGRFILVEDDYEYRVLRIYKGGTRIDRGDMIAIDDGGNPSEGVYTDCAPGSAPGRRYGLFLDRRRGGWYGNACTTVSPKRMRWAAEKERHGAGGAASAGAAACSSSR
jgi:hypothetical protein